ncbi:MAG: hypothetical protein ACI9BW_000899 [Gammaproteobacteria bacterium]|jgi:hypothetical protein
MTKTFRRFSERTRRNPVALYYDNSGVTGPSAKIHPSLLRTNGEQTSCIGRPELVTLLLNAGIDIRGEHGYSRSTPAQLAIIIVREMRLKLNHDKSLSRADYDP